MSESPSFAIKAQMNISPTTPPGFPAACLSLLLSPWAAAAPGQPPYECMATTTSCPLSTWDKMTFRIASASLAVLVSYGLVQSQLGLRSEIAMKPSWFRRWRTEE